MSNSLSKPERQKLATWFRMVRFINQSNNHSNDFLKQFGLTVSQFDMLNQILLHQPLTQKELAEHLIISKGGISQMVKKLEDNGWITREKKATQKYLTLTLAGQQLMDKCQLQQARFQAAMFDGLSADENEALAQIVRKLNNQLKEKGVVHYVE